MMLQSDSYYFWAFFPFWLAVWIMAAYLFAVVTSSLRRFPRLAVTGVVAASATAYVATLYPYVWRHLLGSAGTSDIDSHVIELTQQCAVGILAAISLAIYEVSQMLLNRIMPTMITRLTSFEQIRSIHRLASFWNQSGEVK